MRKMRKWMRAAILISGAMLATSCQGLIDAVIGVEDNPVAETPKKDVTDYSLATSWHKIPEITKEFDTFYIPATNYDGYEQGDPDYAPLDDAGFIAGVTDEYGAHATA